MIRTRTAALEERVLVLAPTPRDAELTRVVLHEAGMRCEMHASFATLAESMRDDAGAIVFTELALTSDHPEALVGALRRQPQWSDVPIIMLAAGGSDPTTTSALLEALGNVTVLERPAAMVTLLSILRSAIRARRRQYELRERINALERTEATLGNSERQFRRLVETSMEGIWQIDLDARTTYVNQRLCDMLGYSADEIMARPLQTFVHSEDWEGIWARLQDGANVAGETSEWRLRRADGSYICVLASAAPVRTASNAVIGAFAMMTDITDRKLSEEALRNAARRKDEFIAVLAHELRNPLAPIRSSLQILRIADEMGTAPPPVLDMLDRQVNHMVHLVDELLEVSRITNGAVELHRESVLLDAVVRTAVEASAPLIHAAEHELTVTLPVVPVVLSVDTVRLAQVLTNLLNNAAKYTARGGQIWLSARSAADAEGAQAIEISVRDTGVGIAPENLAGVFEMFSQIDKNLGRAYGGLGIGLSLARSLVHLHGGTIQALSEGPGRGSEFVVRLPLLVVAAPPVPADAPKLQPLPVPGAVAGRRILIVDDNADAADSLAALLRTADAVVDVVYDGYSALDAWRREQHELVLLDLGMAGMTGYELAHHIRAHEARARPVLIALSGWGKDDDRTRTREAGVDHHLVKPVDFGALQHLLATIPREGAGQHATTSSATGTG